MTHDIEIKQITVNHKDYTKVNSLINDVLRTPFGMKKYERWPSDENLVFVVAYQGSDVVGCFVLSTEDKTLVGEQMAVASSMQGKGVGKKLHNYAIKYAMGNEFEEIKFDSRMTSLPFHEKCGYKRSGEEFIKNMAGVELPFIKVYKKIKN